MGDNKLEESLKKYVPDSKVVMGRAKRGIYAGRHIQFGNRVSEDGGNKLVPLILLLFQLVAQYSDFLGFIFYFLEFAYVWLLIKLKISKNISLYSASSIEWRWKSWMFLLPLDIVICMGWWSAEWGNFYFGFWF